jgi:transcriptional regulator with XRE-family HTH domain
MATRERPADRGRQQVARALRALADDLREARVAAGISQRQIARSVGVSATLVSRLERNQLRAPNLEHLAAIAAVLGLAVRISASPDGEPVHDRVQLRLLAAFRNRLHPSLAWRTELPLPIPGDRRAWDAVAIGDDGWTGFEGVTRFGAVDATLRRINQKQRDDPRIARVVIVIADTVRNRRAMALGLATIRADFPLDSRTVIAALSAGRPPPLNGVVLQRIPADPDRS